MRRSTWCWPRPWAKEHAVRSLQPLEEQARGRPAALGVRVDRPAGTWRALLARREVSVAALLVIGSVLFDLTHPSFLTFGNISSILTNVAVVATISIGMTMVIVTGGIASWVLVRRPLGRHVYALGGNPEAARLAGVNVRLVTIFVYAVTGVLVGLAAVIQLGLSGTVQPNAGTGLELQVIAATVIGGTSILGGRGTVAGSILGALLVETVHSALITIGTISLLEGLVVGLLILIAVGFDVLQNRGATKV